MWTFRITDSAPKDGGSAIMVKKGQVIFIPGASLILCIPCFINSAKLLTRRMRRKRIIGFGIQNALHTSYAQTN